METRPYVLCALFDGWRSPFRSLSSSLSRFSHSSLFDPNLIRLIDEYVAPLTLIRVCDIPEEYAEIHLVHHHLAYSSGKSDLTDTLHLLDVGTTLTLRGSWRLSDQPKRVMGVYPWMRDEIMVFIEESFHTAVWTLDHTGCRVAQFELPAAINRKGFAVDANKGRMAQVSHFQLTIFDAQARFLSKFDIYPHATVDALAFHSVQDKIFASANGEVVCFDFQGHCLFKWSCYYNTTIGMSCTSAGVLYVVQSWGVTYHRQDDEKGGILAILHTSNLWPVQSKNMFRLDKTLVTAKSLSYWPQGN